MNITTKKRQLSYSPDGEGSERYKLTHTSEDTAYLDNASVGGVVYHG